jgi:hydroxymethylbilane synthase
VAVERAFLKRLEGGCQVPIAAHGRLSAGVITMDGLVGSVTGDRIVRGSITGKAEDAEALGIALAEDILSRGAKEILDEVYGRCAPPVDGEISS